MLANCLCNKYLSPLHQWTPLYMAAEGGHEEMVRFLVDKGADINIKDNNGVSILPRVNYSITSLIQGVSVTKKMPLT